MRAAALVLAAAALAGPGPALAAPLELVSGALPGEARAAGASADGATTFLAVGGLPGGPADLVQLRGGIATTIGPGTPLAVAGARLILTTDADLAPGDGDGRADVYVWDGAAARLVPGLAAVNGVQLAALARVSADGQRIAYRSTERLLPEDADDAADVYRWTDGALELATPATARDVDLAALSADGSRLLVATAEPLLPTADGRVHLFEPSGGALVQLPYDGVVGGLAPDGSRVWLETPDALASADADDRVDVYGIGVDGPSLVTPPARPPIPRAGSATRVVWAAPDGSRVVVSTRERLTRRDHDDGLDLYAIARGRAQLLSGARGGAEGAADVAILATAAETGTVVFSSAEALIPGAPPNGLYVTGSRGPVQVDGTTLPLREALLRPGGPARLVAISSDGRRVVIETASPLVEADLDASVDVYEWAAGKTTLLSAGVTPGRVDLPARAGGVSADGALVLVESAEQLDPRDGDDGVDVFASRLADGSRRAVRSTAPWLALGATDILVGADGGIEITLRCRAAAGCAAEAALVSLPRAGDDPGPTGDRALVAALGEASGRRGEALVVHGRLTAWARAALARTGRLRVTLAVRDLVGDAPLVAVARVLGPR